MTDPLIAAMEAELQSDRLGFADRDGFAQAVEFVRRRREEPTQEDYEEAMGLADVALASVQHELTKAENLLRGGADPQKAIDRIRAAAGALDTPAITQHRQDRAEKDRRRREVHHATQENLTAERARRRVLEEALRARRECFVGALTDVKSLRAAVANLEEGRASRDGFLLFAKPTLDQREPLLELAIRQVDEALGEDAAS